MLQIHLQVPYLTLPSHSCTSISRSLLCDRKRKVAFSIFIYLFIHSYIYFASIEISSKTMLVVGIEQSVVWR